MFRAMRPSNAHNKHHKPRKTVRRCLHEISFWVKSNVFISATGQFLVTGQFLIQDKIKLAAIVIPLQSFWQTRNFISTDILSCKHYPKWNHTKRNICTCVYFIKARIIGFSWIGCFSRSTLETKFHFISFTIKSNVNRISFMVGLNSISVGFHFKSHVNTLSKSFSLSNQVLPLSKVSTFHYLDG